MKKVTTFTAVSLMLLGILPMMAVDDAVHETEPVNAQQYRQKKISGAVSDADGEPLAGAIVTIEGTDVSAIADADGHFTIMSPVPNPVLKVGYVGFVTKTVKVSGAVADIVMEHDASLLDEVVVVGYGTVKKSDLTGAVSVIDSKRLEGQSVTMLSQKLQGAIPGLTVTRSGSGPGEGATLRVRGTTTINDSSPLIVVDGVPVSSINDISAGDIEQLTVLKDAASAAIYGARAAAGVVLITTKRAKDGDMNVSYSGEFSIQKPTSFVETVGAIEYMNMFNEYKWNDTGNAAGSEYSQYEKEYIDNYLANSLEDPVAYPNTNWKDLYLKDCAPRYSHTLLVSYGSGKVSTRASLGYEKSEAIYAGSDFSRYRGRLNNQIKLNDHWDAAFDVAFIGDVNNDPQTDLAVKHASKYPAIYPALYPDGSIAPGKTGSNTYAVIREGGFIKQRTNKLNAKVSLTYSPIKNLSITGTIAPMLINSKTKNFKRAIPYYSPDDKTVVAGYISGHERNALEETRADRVEWTKQLFANYSAKFNNVHNMTLMAGYEDFSYRHETLSSGSDDMTLKNFPYLNMGNKNNLSSSGSASEYGYRSFLGRATYNYGDRYLFQANLRADGSSRFHKKYRWGYFPSVSAAWVLSNESFMRWATVLDHFKVRASYGTLGNERIGSYYPYQAIVDFSDAVFVNGKGELTSAMTAAQTAYAVSDISWEKTSTYDIGVDATLFNGRMDITADIYSKRTKDMLLAVKIPGFMGFDDPDCNAGSMTTKGWEFRIGWNDYIGPVRYGASFNISNSTSRMGDMNGTSFLGDQIIREGSLYKEWYGYVSDGLFQTEEEVASSPKLLASNRPGDVKYKDISGPDGVPDGKIDPTYDKVLLGSSQPHYVYGGTINLNYKGFSLSMTFNGVGSRKSRLTQNMVVPFEGKWLSPPKILTGKYWSVYNTPEQNEQARYPRLSESSLNANYEMSDFWLIDGSYFRLQNVTLGYTLPSSILRHTFLQDVRFHISGQDLFSIDNFPEGYDPETTVSSYIARTFTFGIDVKF